MRPARLVAVEPPSPDKPDHVVVEPGRLVAVAELAHLFSTHRMQIQRMVDAGMPCVDLSCPRPGRRRKRLLRFDPVECARWLRERRP